MQNVQSSILRQNYHCEYQQFELKGLGLENDT